MHLHIGFAGQGQDLRIVRRALQRGRQGSRGIVRLRALELDLRQQLAGIDVVRIAFQIFAQVLVGLLQRAEVQLGRAGQQDAGQVVGQSSTSAATFPFRYTDGVGMQALGLPPGALGASGEAINNRGQVVVNAAVSTM